MDTETLLVITNLPDRESAAHLARELVGQRLAACVNILPPCSSVYHWHGKVETAEETPVFIKTLQTRYPAVQQAIRQHHPYELPEIIAVPIADGLPEYLAWIAAETGCEQ